MSADHKRILEQAAAQYDIPNDFEQVNIDLAHRLIAPFCEGKDVLEIGCGSGEMSEKLIACSKSLTIVEPAAAFHERAKERFGEKACVHGCFLHEIAQVRSYDVIVMASLLHHIEDPLAFLATVRPFCGPDTRVLATVPHVKSLHRRVGVKAGLIKEVHDDTERNKRYRQYCKFDRDNLAHLFVEGGFKVHECFGYMLKPFSSEQMMDLRLDSQVIDALFEMGKEFPELSSQLFLSATVGRGDLLFSVKPHNRHYEVVSSFMNFGAAVQ
jgi:2-polyprenyl-3-methyl-5-hydroxy-6-metoxy-1,4-benzoquinol methylase